MQVRTLLLIGLALLTPLAGRVNAAEPAYDWDTWRSIVVQQGGRMKPLDTLAWEFVVSVTNNRGTIRPEAFAAIGVDDIKSFPELVAALKTVSQSSGNPAAKRIWENLPKDLRTRIENVDLKVKPELQQQLKEVTAQLDKLRKEHSKHFEVQTIDQLKSVASDDPAVQTAITTHMQVTAKLLALDQFESDLVLALNDLVGWKELYDANAWPESSLSKQAAEWVRAGVGKLDAPQLQQLNSTLIRQTFPEVLEELKFGAADSGMVVVEDRKYSAIELYVTWVLSWQGWGNISNTDDMLQGRYDETYWRFQEPDAWDQLPLINARFEPLKPKLKPETLSAVSPHAVFGNKEFIDWALSLMTKRQADEVALTPAEEKGLEVFQAYMNYAHQRVGLNMQVGPEFPGSDSTEWLALTPLILLPESRLVDNGYDAAAVSMVREGFHQARKGLLSKNAEEFNAGSKKFADGLAKLGRASDLYPTQAEIAREVHYNLFKPFYKTTIASFLAAGVLVLGLMVRSKVPYYFGYAIYLAAMGLSAYGMYLRVMITGRGPVTNMYETIIWSAFVCAVMAVILNLVYRERVITLVGSVVLGLATLLAYNMPPEMGQALTPLTPVLRSNYWLVVHVMTIVASYGAFMLAWALGNVGLGYYLAKVGDQEVHKKIGKIIYRSMQVGVLLLAAGTILGGWWAAESWGRFWGWDPKEVWALIALLLYLAILHARYAGWVRLFGLHAWTVVAFSGVVMAWYGVNFVLGAGLHAYAFGSGGRIYVVGALIINLLYVITVAVLHNSRLNQRVEAAQKDPELEIDESASERDLSVQQV